MRVREGTPRDLPRLREIQTGALAEPWPDLLEAAVSGPLGLRVLDDDGPVGYAIVVGAATDTAYVPEFAVHPDAQGEGYGSRLMDTLKDRLAREGYASIRLTVRVTDERARAFYRDHGFERVDRLDDHFESGDGFAMTCSLAGRAID